MKKTLSVGLAGSILGLGLLAVVQAAETKPEDVASYRQSVYNIIGWNFKPIGAMVKGEVPFDAAAVARHAQYVEPVSYTHLPKRKISAPIFCSSGFQWALISKVTRSLGSASPTP